MLNTAEMERGHTWSCTTSKVAGSKRSTTLKTMKRNTPVIDQSVAEDEAGTSSTGKLQAKLMHMSEPQWLAS